MTDDPVFAAAFDALLTQIRARIVPPSLDDAKSNAEKDVWTLLEAGVFHLQCGAPDGQPGTLAEALSRASLRAAPLAAALGVKPPQFEPILLPARPAAGDEAAGFLCRKLLDAAEEDFPKSRKVLQQKILAEKPGNGLKEHMAIAFDALTEAYPRACADLKSILRY